MKGWKTRERVQERHELIVRMRERGWLLRDIAKAVGFLDHSSVLHHLAGRCRCEAISRDHCLHDWVQTCRFCGAVP